MVFSFFKKQPEKVVPKATVARPRAPLPEMKVPPPQAGEPQKLEKPLPDLEFSVEACPPGKGCSSCTGGKAASGVSTAAGPGAVGDVGGR